MEIAQVQPVENSVPSTRTPFRRVHLGSPRPSEPPRRTRKAGRLERNLFLSTLLLLGLTAAMIFGDPLRRLRPTSPHALILSATDLNSRMRVSWDPGVKAVQEAEGATLEVIDGAVTNRYPIEPRVLRSGTFDYLRQSEDVLLTVTLYRDGRPGLQGVIRSVGKPATAALGGDSGDPQSEPETEPAKPARGGTSRR